MDLHRDIFEQLDIIKTLISMEMINAASPTKLHANLHMQFTYAQTNENLPKSHTLKYPNMLFLTYFVYG